ncbi:type II secretion system protein GspM [Paenibacillus pinistramenti]|uniref:type II secretion system protein GspM n=1 Tax=Paenibacillus pinistramenti TaxID=1768003 RepID=UPI001396A7C9|nr:type II secretion system protein GspM [Paenibacillus pinistramenti]
MEQVNKYRSSIVLGLLVMFLVLFGFYLFAIRPASHKVTDQDNQIAQLQEERTLYENKIAELQQAAASPDPAEEAALQAIPKGDDSESLINELQRIGDDSHARLKDISFTLADPADTATWTGLSGTSITGLKEIKMSGIIEGGYTEIHDWLKQLNTLPRLVSVDSFAFQQPYEIVTAQQPGSILTANVSFTAYYEAETANTPAP